MVLYASHIEHGDDNKSKSDEQICLSQNFNNILVKSSDRPHVFTDFLKSFKHQINFICSTE